ncbi:DUF6732 family protein [Roseicyclus sp. F158]|uniref:DUF6732 family protein n=1 Tax=Tropicimonas omnivorans TaxID=3075590 RepID=A0ABU3DC99_9RHOB|nr:DUF6732 family protein [Roseicyclus sp. F158]MDT0681340.1 DUF6732 family protein [Roseicyclus sp. F158]
MIRTTLALPAALLLPTAATAHPGHVAETAAGHDHWVAGAAIGIAIVLFALGIWREVKGRRANAAKASRKTADNQGA